MNKYKDTELRYASAPYFQDSEDITILLLGAGGIGSNTAFALSRSIKSTIIVVDYDIVETHNTGTQFFIKDSIGKSKVYGLSTTLTKFATSAKFQYLNSKTTGDIISPITITAFDNMEARKLSFEAWCNLPDREIFIDGRLIADQYTVYTVLPGNEDRYRETLFDDADIPAAPCTYKQTSHFGLLIGARITNIMLNFITNKLAKEDICRIPFSITEYGSLILTKIEK